MEATTNRIATPVAAATRPRSADQIARTAEDRALPQLGLHGIGAVWAAAEALNRAIGLEPECMVLAQITVGKVRKEVL